MSCHSHRVLQRIQEANTLRHPAPSSTAPLSYAPLDQSLEQHMHLPQHEGHLLLHSPRRENDASPLPSSSSHAPQHVDDCATVSGVQDDEVAGFLLARTLPETELRLASRFKNVDYDVRCFWWLIGLIIL